MNEQIFFGSMQATVLRRHWKELAFITVVALIAGLAQTSGGHSVMRSAGLFQEPAAYSELAFTSPNALPEILASGKNVVNVSFDIHNVTGSVRNYQWSILLVQSDRSQLEGSGVARTLGQKSASVKKLVPVVCTAGRIQLVVRLASPSESIDFWMTCQDPSRNAP